MRGMMEGKMSEERAKRIAFGQKMVAESVQTFDRLFGEVESSWKGDGTRVTEADLLLSRFFQDKVADAFPQDQYFSEESIEVVEPIRVKPGFAWLVDPIDGTNNFARGVPACSISVALLENGDPVYGYVYDYSLRTVLHGGPERGLFIGERAAQPSALTVVDRHTIIATQSSSDEDSLRDDTALQRHFKIRAVGSSAIQIAYVALGRIDGVIAHTVKNWDVAAGVAMLKAANLGFHSLDGQQFPVKRFDPRMKGFAYVAGSSEVVRRMLQIIG